MKNKKIIALIKTATHKKSRERERERAKLQSDIDKLKEKPNRTAEEDQQIEDKQKKLEELDKKQINSNDNSDIWRSMLLIAFILTTAVLFIKFVFWAAEKKGKGTPWDDLEKKKK